MIERPVCALQQAFTQTAMGNNLDQEDFDVSAAVCASVLIARGSARPSPASTLSST
jgi:hypothetical protein